MTRFIVCVAVVCLTFGAAHSQEPIAAVTVSPGTKYCEGCSLEQADYYRLQAGRRCLFQC